MTRTSMSEVWRGSGGRILVAGADGEARESLRAHLERERYEIETATELADAWRVMQGRPADLVLLDLDTPGGDGLAFCRELRSAGLETGVVVVTGSPNTVDRVLALEFGADEVLTRPFEPRELSARVRNLVRRVRRTAPDPSAAARIARFGPWRLDLLQRRLTAADGRAVALSSAEFRLLGLFLRSRGATLSRDELLGERRSAHGVDRSIDLQISRLRQKLAVPGSGRDFILTVRNEGYVFAEPVVFD